MADGMNEIPFRTLTGRVLDLKNPNPDLIDPTDIAHNLARNCRYTGSVKNHYSVAQHCWYVSKYLEDTHEDEVTQLKGLLHDAAETYTGDLHGPLKKYIAKHTSIYADIEMNVELAIGKRFGIEIFPMLPQVHIADFVLLRCEKRDLLKDSSYWEILKEIPDWNTGIVPWGYKKARQRWLNRFYQLWLGKASA